MKKVIESTFLVQITSLDKDRRIFYVSGESSPLGYRRRDEKFLETVMNEERPVELVQRRDYPLHSELRVITTVQSIVPKKRLQ